MAEAIGIGRRDFLKLFKGRIPKKGLLRPPGAADDFLSLCNGCGDCAKACPYESLKMESGFPRLIPWKSPCYLCDGFPCIKACRVGALGMVEGKRQVRIGVAAVRREDCLAWEGGSDCQMCFIRCPFMGEAITLEDLKPVIQEEHCTGCGLCEYACATVNDRNAITVIPLSDRKRTPELVQTQ